MLLYTVWSTIYNCVSQHKNILCHKHRKKSINTEDGAWAIFRDQIILETGKGSFDNLQQTNPNIQETTLKML